jgi:hypothetical protein
MLKCSEIGFKCETCLKNCEYKKLTDLEKIKFLLAELNKCPI